jgi:hypothetical protein
LFSSSNAKDFEIAQVAVIPRATVINVVNLNFFTGTATITNSPTGFEFSAAQVAPMV